MRSCIFYSAGNSPALNYAIHYLKYHGYTFAESPSEEITHLLLPVPSLSDDGCIRGGPPLPEVLQKLPNDIGIIGGNLPTLSGYTVYDLLKDSAYVAENAYITAHCAVRLVMEKLPVALRGCKILVIGWGRIGKCLGALLKGLEADVSIAARKDSDRAMINALGYRAVDTTEISIHKYRVIFNTAPALILPRSPGGCLKIDLASTPGISGEDVIHARGLPGRDAPEASGNLIARTVLRLLGKEEIS